MLKSHMNMSGEFKVKLFSDIGMEVTFMSRLMHFQGYIIDGLFGLKNRDEVKNSIMHVIFYGLEPAYRNLREAKKKWEDESIPEREKIQHIEGVYSYLVIAFKVRFQETAKLMGYDIGFLFQNENNFDKGLSLFSEKHPNFHSAFIESLKSERKSWLNITIEVRNILINHGAGKDPKKIKDLECALTLESAEIIFENCWRCIEDILAIFADDILDPRLGIQILNLKEYTEDKNVSERFGYFEKRPSDT